MSGESEWQADERIAVNAPEEPLSPYAGLAKKIRPDGSAALEAYQATPPKLVIRRGGPAEWTNLRVPLTPAMAAWSLFSLANMLPGVEYYIVLLDDQEIGRIRENETFRADIPAGEHNLTIREHRWLLPRSKSARLTIANGQKFSYVCSTLSSSLLLRRVD